MASRSRAVAQVLHVSQLVRSRVANPQRPLSRRVGDLLRTRARFASAFVRANGQDLGSERSASQNACGLSPSTSH